MWERELLGYRPEVYVDPRRLQHDSQAGLLYCFFDDGAVRTMDHVWMMKILDFRTCLFPFYILRL